MAPRPSAGRGPRRRRLSRSAEFERVYRQGRSKANRFLVLYAFPREDAPGEPVLVPHEPSAGLGSELASAGGPDPAAPGATGPRLGLSVSRRVGGAVDRNRVKRVLREAFWAEAERLPISSDYVVVARPDARELAEREGMAGVRRELAELVDGLKSGGKGATA